MEWTVNVGLGLYFFCALNRIVAKVWKKYMFVCVCVCVRTHFSKWELDLVISDFEGWQLHYRMRVACYLCHSICVCLYIYCCTTSIGSTDMLYLRFVIVAQLETRINFVVMLDVLKIKRDVNISYLFDIYFNCFFFLLAVVLNFVECKTIINEIRRHISKYEIAFATPNYFCICRQHLYVSFFRSLSRNCFFNFQNDLPLQNWKQNSMHWGCFRRRRHRCWHNLVFFFVTSK